MIRIAPITYFCLATIALALPSAHGSLIVNVTGTIHASTVPIVIGLPYLLPAIGNGGRAEVTEDPGGQAARVTGMKGAEWTEKTLGELGV